jgi:phospholipid transport system substrate-binding protein
MLTLLMLRCASADELAEGRELISATMDSVVRILQDKSIVRDQRQEKVMAVMRPVFDFEIMAKLTLGRDHWPRLNTAQQKEFVDLFIQQLQVSYFDKAEQFANEPFGLESPVMVDGKLHVEAYVRSKGERLTMKYKLYRTGGRWRVYDVEIAGVSLVVSFSSQYAPVMRDGSAADLLESMRKAIGAAKG